MLAARDQRGTEPLFWGTSNFGETLLLSNDLRVLEALCPDADVFPSGTLFGSKCGEVTGELTMLMSDECEGEEGWAWDDVDFLVQDGHEAAEVAAEEQKDMRLAAERRWHHSTGGMTRGLGVIPHHKLSFQNLNRVDSERSMHTPYGSENNLRDMIHRVSSQGKIQAAA